MGFEPMVPLWGTLTFQASTFDHSVTSPKYTISEAQIN